MASARSWTGRRNLTGSPCGFEPATFRSAYTGLGRGRRSRPADTAWEAVRVANPARTDPASPGADHCRDLSSPELAKGAGRLQWPLLRMQTVAAAAKLSGHERCTACPILAA